MTKSDDLEPGMTTHRIENLADGIFSIAMTLLVLNLALPEMGTDLTPTTELHELLFGQTHEFFNYALSFILLAIFWSMHHQQFHFIKRTDTAHLWINVFIGTIGIFSEITGFCGNQIRVIRVIRCHS